MRSMCSVDERGGRRENRGKEKTGGKREKGKQFQVNYRGNICTEREAGGNRDSLVGGVSENTADLCGGAKEEKASRTSLEIR